MPPFDSPCTFSAYRYQPIRNTVSHHDDIQTAIYFNSLNLMKDIRRESDDTDILLILYAACYLQVHLQLTTIKKSILKDKNLMFILACHSVKINFQYFLIVLSSLKRLTDGVENVSVVGKSF